MLHGTSKTNIQNIISQGLLPNQPKNWEIGPATNKLIYLTNNVEAAEYYGVRSSLITNSTEYSIIELKCNKNNIYPDENYYLDQVKFPVTHEFLVKHKTSWKKCLKTCGLVAYLNNDISKNICKINTYPIHTSWYYKILENFPNKTIKLFDELICILTSKKITNELLKINTKLNLNKLSIEPIENDNLIITYYNKTLIINFVNI